jgi:outer membrane protein assembly factor BamB
MLLRDGILYAVTDAGVAMCWHSDTGKEIWKSRLGGTFSASPVLVGDKIFATNREGQTFTFKASPKAFELVAENRLGDEVFSTPAICGSQIFMRVAFHKDGSRQETLYCLGK